jgi:hypothetical protein
MSVGDRKRKNAGGKSRSDSAKKRSDAGNQTLRGIIKGGAEKTACSLSMLFY